MSEYYADADALGTQSDAAAQDGDATSSSVQSLVKGLHDVLWDADGVVAWAAGAAPANGVSMAEALRKIYDDLVIVDAFHDVATADATTNAQMSDVIGNKTDAADQDADATQKSLVALLKGVLDVLYDDAGVAAWPAGAAPANGVSIAEGLRYVSERVDSFVNKNTFWSDVQEEVQLGSTAADVNLPNVVLPNITGTIVRVYGVFRCRAIENTNVAANKLSGADNIRIKKSTGTWGTDDVALINFVDDYFGVAASTREVGQFETVGDNDVVSEVDALNATYNIRWEDGQTDENNLNFNDVQAGLIVEWY